MKIFEVVYDNGWMYEDNERRSYFFETREEAQKFYDEYVEPDNGGVCYDSSLNLNTLELGTQVREDICHKVLTKYVKPEWSDLDWVKDDEDLKEVGNTLLGDLDALLSLKEKLARA